MEKISIANIDFNLVRIDVDKILLQASNHNFDESIPRIGEYIQNNCNDKVQNIVAAETELLIYFDQGNIEALVKELGSIESIDFAQGTEIFPIDVCFELGLDWGLVENACAKAKEEIVEIILKSSYPLINYGFQPGFMYLDNLPKQLNVARRDTPRFKVPKGSLAIGGKYIGIYGSESPGGWNIIGRSSHFSNKHNEFDDFPAIQQSIKFNRLTKEEYLRKYHHE